MLLVLPVTDPETGPAGTGLRGADGHGLAADWLGFLSIG